MRIYYWVEHTGTYDGNTGVQRVVRGLASALTYLDLNLVPVCWCPEREAIICAEHPWLVGLARFGGPCLPEGSNAGEPIHLVYQSDQLHGAWFLLPEVPHVAGGEAPNLATVLDYARFHGLRIAAVFYDLIPLRQPGYEALAADHEHYARALVASDLLLAISDYSAADLRVWWSEQGYDPARLPRVLALPLPEEMLGAARAIPAVEPPSPPVRFLAWGTIEPRKNQLAAIQAFARLCVRRPDLDLRFDLVGGIHSGVSEAVRAVAAAVSGVTLHGYLPDTRLRALLQLSHATIFLSLEEGYGLPIAESLWQGKPCLSADHGAMAEIARGGGCLMVRASDLQAIERGFERLATDPMLRRKLADEACARKLRSWVDYGEAVIAALAAAPALDRVVAIEGEQGGASFLTAFAGVGLEVRRLHWHAGSRALLPGTSQRPEQPALGAGRLDGLWALVGSDPTADDQQTAEIIASANGLGLRVALEAAPDTSPELLYAADVALFTDEAARQAALTRGLRELPRTVTFRDRLRVGAGEGALTAIAGCQPRIAAAGAPQIPKRIFYWVGLTATQPFNTGIQRVCRQLAASLQRLGVDVVLVKWDAVTNCMTPLTKAEADSFAQWSGPPSRPEQHLPDNMAGEWLLLPEITVPVLPLGSDVAQLGRSLGMRTAAIFYDLIPEKTPQFYPPEALANIRAYWRTFATIDLALPISWTAAADLVRYMRKTGMRVPKVVPCPLAGDAGASPRELVPPAALAPGAPLLLLVVGTWEPRKNHARLLRALKVAQAKTTRPIALTLVGRRAGFGELDDEIIRLAALVGAELRNHVTDDELLELYRISEATVFASWEEGFGLPVLESLWHGRPCLCHAGSAMAELTPGGGVLAIDMLDEAAIASSLLRLADEPGLLTRLGAEAVLRAVRSWDEYASDVLLALSRAGASPGWPLPAIGRRRPLLSISITTFNRGPWLAHSLQRVLEATRPWRDVVEVVVCDNASTDNTSNVVNKFTGERNFSAHRNSVNVGMLGNLGVTARFSRGAFVWLLGDDDLLIDGAIEQILEGLAAFPDVEMAYMNYAYTHFDAPEQLTRSDEVIARATPIAVGGPNRRVSALRDVAALNENLFTAIYACAFRRDHALRGYQLDTRGSPFSSLVTCVPSSVYALAALQDRPAWWVGNPAVVVNMNVSWLRWRLLWHLERMPDLFEAAERRGVDPTRLDRYRLQHLEQAEQWVRAAYFEAEDSVRNNIALSRLLERCKHLPEFRANHLAGVARAYGDAWAARRVVSDPVPPKELFARYGLSVD
jgi:glycosyltransferase involved in cell wall biosynthesis